MNYRTISDLNQLILKRLYILPRDFDLIVGIPRSGMFPANLLALYLSKPYTDLDSFINGHIYKAGARGEFFNIKSFKKVLVVDDSIASGMALEKCKKKLESFKNDFDFKYCAIYVAPEKKDIVDYYFELTPLPRYFQWNILHHTILQKSCLDIDGVLCVDPPQDVNDDGDKYIDFLLNAPALYIPNCKVGTLVTSRLEKYRTQTEEWLRKNNVKYDRLVMSNHKTMESRQAANDHAAHKAKEYASKGYSLFVESSLSQAIEINRITGKPVLCTENFEMIFNSKSLYYNIKSGQSLPFVRRTLLRLRRIIGGR
ncbi:MAG: phosphoribosyltransferase family protein [Rikenellaceae bacterium]